MKASHYSLSAICFFIAGSVAAQAQEEEAPAKSPYAMELIERAATFLAAQEQFSVKAEIWEDIIIDGKKLQFTRTAEAWLRRPDRIKIDLAMYSPTKSIFYDGETVTMVDQQRGFYASAEAKESIDETIVALDEQYGISFPLEDVLFSKPFGNAAANATTAQYLGKVTLLGQECEHVAFQYPMLAWQAWIATGPEPVIVKVVIDYQNPTDGVTTLTALFSNWNFATALPDYLFEFKPAVNQVKIEVATLPAAQNKDAQE